MGRKLCLGAVLTQQQRLELPQPLRAPAAAGRRPRRRARQRSAGPSSAQKGDCRGTGRRYCRRQRESWGGLRCWRLAALRGPFLLLARSSRAAHEIAVARWLCATRCQHILLFIRRDAGPASAGGLHGMWQPQASASGASLFLCFLSLLSVHCSIPCLSPPPHPTPAPPRLQQPAGAVVGQDGAGPGGGQRSRGKAGQPHLFTFFSSVIPFFFLIPGGICISSAGPVGANVERVLWPLCIPACLGTVYATGGRRSL